MNPRGESVWLPHHEPRRNRRMNLDSWKTAGGCVGSGATLSNIDSVHWEPTNGVQLRLEPRGGSSTMLPSSCMSPRSISK